MIKKCYVNGVLLLPRIKMATSTFAISKGLMFAGEKKIKQGICLVMPASKDVQFGASVTMFFCRHPMDILFVNSDMKVVDKVTLKTWVANYTPKAPCKYILESWKGSFGEVKLGDSIELK